MTTPDAVAKQTLAVDYSFARPSLATIRSQGFVAVGRYLGNSSSKLITDAEAKQIRAHGLGLWLVWETTAVRATAGHAAGVADAKAARAQAAKVGYPTNAPIFFAVDFDATPAQVRSYFEGVHSVLGGRTGVYGGIRVTEGLRDLCPFRWQTAAWSGGKVDPECHLYQRIGSPISGTDVNVICREFPMLGRDKTHPAPKPAPKPKVPTRVENFHTKVNKTGIADVRILDRAAANGRKDAKDCRNRLAFQVRQLPHDKGSSRVNKVTDTFAKARTIDLNLLDAAVKAGRVGKVKQVRDRIKALIGQLPPW